MERSEFGTVRRARSGRYHARVRVRGRRMAIGTFDTRREAAQALGSFAANYDAWSLVDRKAGRQTVGDSAESWWTRAGHRPSTRVRDREALDRYVLPFFRDAQLGRLDRTDVQEWPRASRSSTRSKGSRGMIRPESHVNTSFAAATTARILGQSARLGQDLGNVNYEAWAAENPGVAERRRVIVRGTSRGSLPACLG